MNPNRKPIIAGNWKMYKTVADAVALVAALKKEVAGLTKSEIVVCPPFTALAAVANTLAGGNIQIKPIQHLVGSE